MSTRVLNIDVKTLKVLAFASHAKIKHYRRWLDSIVVEQYGLLEFLIFKRWVKALTSNFSQNKLEYDGKG